MTRSWSLALLLSLLAPLGCGVARPAASPRPRVRRGLRDSYGPRAGAREPDGGGARPEDHCPRAGRPDPGAGKRRADRWTREVSDARARRHARASTAGIEQIRSDKTLFLLAANGVTTIRNMDYCGAISGQTTPLLRWRARGRRRGLGAADLHVRHVVRRCHAEHRRERRRLQDGRVRFHQGLMVRIAVPSSTP